MKFKWILAAATFFASATAFAQAAPAVDNAPVAQPVSASAAAAIKSKAVKDGLIIAAAFALGAVALDNMSDSSDDRPSSP